MMMKRLTLLLTGILSLLSPAQDQAAREQGWRNSLGAGDFKTRAATMTEIWGEGRGSLEFLESLIQGADPELVGRATTVVRKIKLGITPETPEEITQLVNRYFGATAKKKLRVIEELIDSDEYDILLRLRRLEEHPDVLSRIDTVITDTLPQIVRGHLNEGKIDEAKEYLSLSQQFQHLIHYAHLLDLSGELEAEIERLSQAKSKEDHARYLACLRVKGAAGPLREIAKELGDHDAESLAALTMGDHLPYLESRRAHTNPTLSNRDYLDWTLANHHGDQAGQKKAYDSLIRLSGKRSEQSGARMSLLRMGYGEVVLESLPTEALTERVDFHLGHENYAKAQKLIGIPVGQGFDAWLEGVATKARKEIDGKEATRELDRLVSAVEFLEARGFTDRAIKVAFTLFDLVRPAKNLKLTRFASQIYFAAPVSTFSAIAREKDEHEAPLKQFLEVLPVRMNESLWLFQKLAVLYPEMATTERLLLTMSFSARRSFVSRDLFVEARDQVLALKEEDGAEIGSLTDLLILLAARNREEDLVLIMKALSEAGRPNHFSEAILAVDQGRYQDAAESYAKMEVDVLATSPEFLYQRGLALKKAGKPEGDEIMTKALLLCDGGILAFRGFAMEHLRYGDFTEAYSLLRRGLLRSEGQTSSSQYWVRSSVISELADESVTLGMWQHVLAYREVTALDAIYSSVSQGVFAIRSRFQILVARGAVAMQKGDQAAAVAAFSKAHRMLPRDGYLANDLFPLLRELGLTELHDELYAETARLCRENIRLYSRDDNVYNNFAWLASRANRDLDEAEGYLEIALKMNPESAAYLDTLGEVYFARRDRAMALSWSTRSLQNDVLGSERTRWELQHQHQRFKSGDFPKK